MLVPNDLKAVPAENYDDLKRQFFALKKLCESKMKQCSNYAKKLAEYDRESVIARNEALNSEREMNAQLTSELNKADERIAELESYNVKLANESHEYQQRCKELEKELTLSTDQNDLLLDEFIRVKHLTDNTEIHGLCERAHVRMRQNVSVIDRNHQLERKVAELKNKVNSLENSDGGLLLKALFYAPSSPVSAAKAEEIESWYEKVKQLLKEQE